MTHDVNFYEDFFEFRHSQVVKSSFSPVSAFFFFVIAPAKLFSRLSLALNRNNLKKFFKTRRHVEQNKENKFPVTSK